MKLYEWIRYKNGREMKILDFSIMERRVDNAIKTQIFFGGLITIIAFVWGQLIPNKEIKILGYSFMSRYKKDQYYLYLMFGKVVYKLSESDVFKKYFFKYFEQYDYDDIYIFRTNSGEVYIFLAYFLDSFIKKNNSKKPLLVATKKYHIDIIKMLCPDLPYLYIEQGKMNIGEFAKEFKVNDMRFFRLYDSLFFDKMKFNLINNNSGKYHYFEGFLDLFEMTNDDLIYRKMIVPPKDERNMLDKVAKIGLNLDKFIFLAPEAQTCILYDEKFWVMLINALQDKGFDVFVNLSLNTLKLEGARDFKTCDLSFTEAFALAKYSKKIVSLRSGFTECLYIVLSKIKVKRKLEK